MAQAQSFNPGRFTPPTSERVAMHTSEEASARIRRETLRRLRDVGHDPSKIEARLCSLSREWDIERLLPGVVGGLLLQHAVQDWCPLLRFLKARRADPDALTGDTEEALALLES